MLKGLETSSMPTAEKEHWQAVGYFFHAFWYMELINRFGDVPWIDKVLDPTPMSLTVRVLRVMKWPTTS